MLDCRKRGQRPIVPCASGQRSAGLNTRVERPLGARAAGPSPGQPRLAARHMRAGGPRSRRAPTPCLVPWACAHRSPGANARVERALGPRAAGPHPAGEPRLTARHAGQRPAVPASTNAVPCSLGLRAPEPRGERSRGTSPGSAGRWPASPGEPRLAARMRAGGPHSRRAPTPRFVPSRPRAGEGRVTHSYAVNHTQVGQPGSAAAASVAHWYCGVSARTPRLSRRMTSSFQPSSVAHL